MSERRPDHDEAANRLETVIQDMPSPRPDAGLRVVPDRLDRLLDAMDAIDVWICEFDGQGRMIYTSPNIEKILGWKPEECVEDNRIELHPDDVPSVVESGRQVRATGVPARNVGRVRHKQGHWIWVDTSILGWYPEEGGQFHSITISRDITDLKAAEAAREEAETRRTAIARMTWDLVSEVDDEGILTYIAPGCEDVIGYTVEESYEIPPWSLIHPEDEMRVRAQIEMEREDPGRRLPPMECRLRHPDGHWVWLETMGTWYTRADGQTRYLAVSRDLTERKRAEETHREFEQSLQRAQKLESLGVLAGGIAHDFNNLLTPILGAARLGIEELPADSPVRDRLEKIQQAAKRAAALTNQMLSYAGQSPLRIERIDLSKLVREMRDLVASSVAGSTVFELDLAEDLPPIEAEEAQIGQVVMNLVTNAAESQSDGHGRVVVRTGVAQVDEPPAGALFAETMEKGKHVFLEVTDAGSGMDAETRARIFDPFYTTKFTGRGLGLAAVSGIVRAHHGAIQVDSEPGRGTRFRVSFPAVEAQAADVKPVSPPIDGWQTTGTALVIDDDEGVRELAAAVLNRAGMTVLTAGDGHEGAKLFAMHADAVDVVLLDRTMPALSGADTFDLIRAERADAKVVLVSGYSEERVAAELENRSCAGFLQKPFTPEGLLAQVREVLEGPA